MFSQDKAKLLGDRVATAKNYFTSRYPFWVPAYFLPGVAMPRKTIIRITNLIIVICIVASCYLLFASSPKSPAVSTEHPTERTSQQNIQNTHTDQASTTPDTFYQFIIDNNIFHPLGWQPPKQQPIYTLIGTAVAQNVEDSKAFILERRSDHLHIVKVGDVFGEALVKVIESKRVILNEAGKEIVLHGSRMQFY